ncbi:MAG: uroporphyrinogen decarboxylase [Rickettsiales bacterium]
MRQAGRYLPEYNLTKEQAGSFLNLCYNPSLAAKVTLQPIQRFDFDAAIIFSDILVVLQSLGMDLIFRQNMGPVLSGERLQFEENAFLEKLNPVYIAIKKVKSELNSNKKIIGFAGAPFTLLAYQLLKSNISEKSSKVQLTLDKKIDRNKQNVEILEKAITLHLLNQIKHGADAVKIFDSWAGLITDHDLYREFVVNPTKRIVERIKRRYPETTVMAFPRNSGDKYLEYVEKVKPDITTIDYNVDLKWANSNLSQKTILQGNLNPKVLLGGKSEIAKETKKIIKTFGARKFVFNLGHGVLPKTPVENVRYLLDIIRDE